jgi:hypothetical protein
MADPSFDQNLANFDAADSAATAAIKEMNSQTSAAPEAPVTPPAAVPETPAAPVTPSLASLKDDDLVEVLIGGVPTQLAWKDAKNNVMMHADYTKKTQEVASARKELEALYSQMQERETKIMTALKDPALVEQYLQSIRQQQVAANPNIDPNSLASVEDVRGLLKQEIAKAQEESKRLVQDTVQELEVTRAATAIRSELDATVEKLKTEYPTLNVIPGVEKILYDEVNRMNPSNAAEAKQYFATVCKGLVEGLDKHYVAQQKTVAVEKQKLVKQGIEPSGPGILPTPKKPAKTFEETDADTIAQIEALMKG